LLYNALSMGKKSSKITPFSWDFVTQPEEDRATAISNTHKYLVETALVIPEISLRTDKHTHRRAHHNTLPPLPGRSKYGQRIMTKGRIARRAVIGD